MVLTEDDIALRPMPRLPMPHPAFQRAADAVDKAGWRRCISSKSVTGRSPGMVVSIGTTSASKIAASGYGRRRPRGSTFCDGRRGSASSRLPVLALKPARAAALSWDVVRRNDM